MYHLLFYKIDKSVKKVNRFYLFNLIVQYVRNATFANLIYFPIAEMKIFRFIVPKITNRRKGNVRIALTMSIY